MSTIGLNEKFSIEECQPDSILWDYSCDDIHIEPQIELVRWKIDYKQLSCFKVSYGNKTIATCLYGINKFNGKDVICINKISFSLQSDFSQKRIIAYICKYLLRKHRETAFMRMWTTPEADINRFFKCLLFIKANHLNPFIMYNLKENKIAATWDVSFFDLD